jgi:DNA-binding transcriptional LysR family regulator
MHEEFRNRRRDRGESDGFTLSLPHLTLATLSSAAHVAALQAYLLHPDPLRLVAPHDHALAGREQPCLAGVADLLFIGLPGSSALQGHIDHYARPLGKRLQYRVDLPFVAHVLGEVRLKVKAAGGSRPCSAIRRVHHAMAALQSTAPVGYGSGYCSVRFRWRAELLAGRV